MDSKCSFLSLEVLDNRFQSKNDIKQNAPRSNWKTWEYRSYLLMFVIVVPIMIKTVMEASNETNPNFSRFQHLLAPGWIGGRLVDNSDPQYRFFRDNFIKLFVFIALHITFRSIANKLSIRRRTFDLGFGLFFLFGAHGFNCFKILFHMVVMFLLARIPNLKLAQLCLWVYGIGTLFLNDRYRLVPYSHIFQILSFMDDFKGLISRWDVFFNFSLLRMLSFNLDYLKAQEDYKEIQKEDDSHVTNDDKDEQLNERQRLDCSCPLDQYNLINYFAYLLYTPLFIAGPILTFNDYMYQTEHTLKSINFKRTAIYGLRLLFCVLTMELILHYAYVVAVSKTKAWEGDTPFQISMIGLFNLNIIWLKLLIPWRLFRFWSLCDQIDPPENMIRCMNNNFSTMQFWRAWHRSFNKWVIKYIYVPLGGSQYRILGSIAVFSFVAIWHDIQLKLLIWGWVIVLFLLPELILTNVFKPFQNEWWFRHVCAVGAVVNIWMMMLANLFGFCLGKDGLILLLKDMFTTLDGFGFFITSSACLFIASQVMFELRASERRRGVSVKC